MVSLGLLEAFFARTNANHLHASPENRVFRAERQVADFRAILSEAFVLIFHNRLTLHQVPVTPKMLTSESGVRSLILPFIVRDIRGI